MIKELLKHVIKNIESIGNDGRVPIPKSVLRFKTPRPITRNKRKHIKP